jgi:hypothetical protein
MPAIVRLAPRTCASDVEMHPLLSVMPLSWEGKPGFRRLVMRMSPSGAKYRPTFKSDEGQTCLLQPRTHKHFD